MGITQHRHAGRRRAGHREPRPGPRQRRAATAPGSCRCAATRACRAAPRWAPTPPRCPAASTVDEQNAARAGRRSGASPCPAHAGLTAPEMLEAAERGELDVLWMSGGNFLDVLPDPHAGRGRAGAGAAAGAPGHRASARRCWCDGDDVILLPVRTRYEQEGGGTETTTERRIVFSPEIPRQVGEARSEWRLFADVAARVQPDLGRALRLARQPGAAGRDRRGRAGLRRHRDARPTPATTCSGAAGTSRAGGVFPTPTGRGRFTVARARPAPTCPTGTFTVATRRGKQFNSMVFGEHDPLTGAGRDASTSTRADAAALGPRRGRSRHPALRDRRATRAGCGSPACPSRSLQVHWPEGNVLIAAGPEHREPGQPGARLQRRRHLSSASSSEVSPADGSPVIGADAA